MFGTQINTSMGCLTLHSTLLCLCGSLIAQCELEQQLSLVIIFCTSWLVLHASSAFGSDTACPAAEDLDEMNIEIMRNTLYKAYLDDFAKFCNKLGGSTAAVMGDLLSFEVCMQQLHCGCCHI